jgi:hypothetical protein
VTHDGLGLVSMQERLHLIKGELLVDSRPGDGTRIHACVRISVRADRMVGDELERHERPNTRQANPAARVIAPAAPQRRPDAVGLGGRR